MTHEMVHLSIPSMQRRHHWFEEGVATYVEPIARVQSGQLHTAKIWADLAELYAKADDAPMPMNLDALWRSLGVTPVGQGVRLNDVAPLVAVRLEIMRGHAATPTVQRLHDDKKPPPP